MITGMVKKFWNRLFGSVNWYNLRSTKPISRVFGLDRGTPIDRYYIEKFLGENKNFIKGNVLEIAESTYSKKFDSGVDSYEVLHVDKSNKRATIIGDLTKPESLPSDKIDCFICTQTFNFIYDFKEAIRGSYKLLNEGGVILATLGGISQISRYDMDRWGDYWRFTVLSARRIFEEIFGEGNVEVGFFGNVLASVAFLEGIASHELSHEELDKKDEDYQMIITVRAIKSSGKN